MGRQETQLRAASCLVEEDCVQGLKTYVSPFRTEMGFGPTSEVAPYPIPLPHLTSVPLLSQHVDPASEKHDAGKTQGILKIKFLGFSFFYPFLKFVRFTQLFGTSLLIMALQCSMRNYVKITVATVLKLVTEKSPLLTNLHK